MIIVDYSRAQRLTARTLSLESRGRLQREKSTSTLCWSRGESPATARTLESRGRLQREKSTSPLCWSRGVDCSQRERWNRGACDVTASVEESTAHSASAGVGEPATLVTAGVEESTACGASAGVEEPAT